MINTRINEMGIHVFPVGDAGALDVLIGAANIVERGIFLAVDAMGAVP